MSNSNLAVADGLVVGIYYTLKIENEVVDSNRKGGKPLVFLAGANNIVAGLEKALGGKQKNDFIEVSISPEDGYGEHNADAVEVVQRDAFPENAPLEVGSRFVASDEAGNSIPTLVTAVDGDSITIDLNHPLAGKTLDFDVTIAGVREATEEETQHGHVHGPGGHEH